MHPAIYHDLVQARIADLHRQAQRDALARAASRSRRAQRRHGAHRVPGLRVVVAGRVLAVLGARSP
jgi:hypothetical protein